MTEKHYRYKNTNLIYLYARGIPIRCRGFPTTVSYLAQAVLNKDIEVVSPPIFPCYACFMIFEFNDNELCSQDHFLNLRLYRLLRC